MCYLARVDSPRGKRAGDTAQLVRYYCDLLSLLPRTHFKKSGVVAGTCNPSTGEAETGSSPGFYWLASQPCLLVEFQVSKKDLRWGW